MYKVHQPHKKSGYLSDVSYESMQDAEGKPDWMMRYVPGPKARNEFEFFTGKPGLLEEPGEDFAAYATPDMVAEAAVGFGNPIWGPHAEIIAAMLKRGISEKQAQALVAELREGQEVMEQLEYADYPHRMRAARHVSQSARFLHFRHSRQHAGAGEFREQPEAGGARGARANAGGGHAGGG